jgi:hypothetical protein
MPAASTLSSGSSSTSRCSSARVIELNVTSENIVLSAQRPAPAPEHADRRLPHKPASGDGAERRPAHPSAPCHVERWTAGAGAMIFDPPETVEESSPTLFVLSRVSGWVSGYEPDTPRGCKAGGSLGGSVHSDPPNEQAAARSLCEIWLCSWHRGRGFPPLRFRFDPGTPFLDQHITDVYGEARCRVLSGSERAAAS